MGNVPLSFSRGVMCDERTSRPMTEINENQDGSVAAQDPATTLKPWSPNVIALITILLSMLPGGILHALNYARLGYPQKKKMALISNVLMATFFIFLSLHTELPRLLSLVINLAYAGYFYKSQDSLFDKHMKKGGKKGSLIGPVIFSAVTAALLVGLSLGYDHLKTAEYDKALSMMTDGNYSEAEQLFKSYKKYEPKEEATYYNLALIYQETGRLDLAISELKLLLKLNPKNPEAQALMVELTGKDTTNTKTKSNNNEEK